MINSQCEAIVLRETQASEILDVSPIQDLWSGYGVINKIALKGGNIASVIVKHVKTPTQSNHPRGWNSDFSHQRKIKSYHVESNWYENYSALCTENHKVPKLIAKEVTDSEFLFVLEDLDSLGYEKRCHELNQTGIDSCLKWLASFHANFMHTNPLGLWKEGSYWHLETRPDEFKILKDKDLIKAAPLWDSQLKKCKYNTLIHGDAKTANFCFSNDLTKVSAVDFQYIGGGCGMKDLAYFMSSCLDEQGCEQHESEILAKYFNYLRISLQSSNRSINFIELEDEWRKLFPIAWCDFLRFLKGWSPTHWKINTYSDKLLRIALKNIK